MVARCQELRVATEVGQPAPECSVTGPKSDHARLRYIADAITVEQQGQTGDMVLVRMGDHDHIEAAVPRREALVE